MISKEKLKSFSDRLSERKNSLRIYENKFRVNIILSILFFALTLCIPLLFSDFMAMAIFFYPPATVGWAVYTSITLKGILKNINGILHTASDGEINYRVYRKLKKDGALKEFEEQQAPATSKDSDGESDAAEDTDEQRAAREKVKKTAITNVLLVIGKRLPLLIAAILILLPLINVNLILADCDVGIVDFVLAKGNTEELEEGVTAACMADLFGIPKEEYKNLFSLWNKSPMSYVEGGTIESANDIFALVWGYFSNTFFIFVSIVAIVVFSIIGLVGTPISVYRLFTVNSVVDARQGKHFAPLTVKDKPLEKKQKGKLRMSIFYLFMKTFVGMLIAFAAYCFIPARLIAYLGQDPLITVSPWLTVALPILVAVSFVFYIIEFWHSVKNAHTLTFYD